MSTSKTDEILGDPSGITDPYWEAYLEHLPLWRKIPFPQRNEIVEKPVLSHGNVTPWAPHPPALLAEGDVLSKFQGPGTPRDAQEPLRLARLFQIAHRIGAIEPPLADEQRIERILRGFVLMPTLQNELADSHHKIFYGGQIRRTQPLNLARLSSTARLQRFLAAEPGTGRAWERDESRHKDSLTLFSGVHVFSAAQKIARNLLDHPAPIPAERLAEILSEKESAFLPKALRGLLQWGFMVMQTDAELDSIRIGLWPGIHRRLRERSTPAQKPKPLAEPAEVFSLPTLATDLESVLATAIGEPLRLKKGAALSLYKATTDGILPKLRETPGWRRLPDKGQRIEGAVTTLLSLQFAKSGFRPPAISPTAAGSAWLRKSFRDRVKFLVDNLLSGGPKRWVNGIDRLFFPEKSSASGIQGHPTKKRLELAETIVAAWKTCPPDQWLNIDLWVRYVLQKWNPIETVAAESGGMVDLKSVTEFGNFAYTRTDAESLSNLALQMITDFLDLILVPIGGADLGRTADDQVCFRLTPIGRYFLKLTKDFPDLKEPDSGKVVLQPNFEIVFLGTNIRAEGAVEPLCERLGHGTGTLFRLSKPRVQNAIDSGKTMESILETLEEITAKSVPDNVRKEMATWGSAIRHFTPEVIVALRCEDPQSAILLRAALGSNATLLTPTVVQIHEPLTSAQRRKLSDKGFFQKHK